MQLKPSQLILTAYAKYEEGQWNAFCLDFDLAAQSDSFEEAKIKLDNMVQEYVSDALVGEDKEYAEQLLSRKAPLFEWLKYYFHMLIHTKNEYQFIHTRHTLPF